MPSAQYSHEELSTFWLKVVDPARIGPALAIASELAAYTGESIDDVLRKMNTGGDDFNDLWHRATVNTTDERSVASFYRDQFVEAYELANWHCGLTYGSFPLNYAKAALYARRLRLARALDFDPVLAQARSPCRWPAAKFIPRTWRISCFVSSITVSVIATFSPG